MTRRLAAAAVAVVALAAACSSGGGTKKQETSATTAAPAPTRGGTLVVAIDSDPGSLNPAVTSNGGVHTAAEPMFNGLVGWGPDNKLAPELATSWKVDDGGATYTFALRDGVKWHDGQPFTSDDVKFTFEKALLPYHSRTKASMGAAGLRLETPDARTVVFRFSYPYAPLLNQLNVTEAPILPRHVYEGCSDISTAAGCPANKAPVGTGPFRYVSYSPTEIRLARNPDYFRPGQPYLDEVVERVIPDAGTRVLSLEGKEADWVWTVNGQDVQRLQANKALSVVAAPRGTGGGNCILQVAFNLKPPAGRLPVLTDLRVRQAFAYATNRRQSADQILFGQGRVADAPISSGITFAHASGLNLPNYDVAKAKSLLDASGWKDEGKPFRVARGVPNIPDGTELSMDFYAFAGQQATYGESLKAQLKEVGINLQTRQVDNATLSDAVFKNRTFDTAIISYCDGDDPEIGVRRQYVTSQIGPTAFSNGAGYSNPEVDALFDQAAREVDPAKRGPLYRRIQEAAVRDLPYWWLAETDFPRAYNAACTGFNIPNTGLFAEGASCKR